MRKDSKEVLDLINQIPDDVAQKMIDHFKATELYKARQETRRKKIKRRNRWLVFKLRVRRFFGLQSRTKATQLTMTKFDGFGGNFLDSGHREQLKN